MFDHALSQLATAARLGRATTPGDRVGARPDQALVLYEFEGCPMCRRVREAITDLALPVDMRPCPVGGERFRPEAERLAGKRQFPFLIDPNTGVSMLESADIVAYLYERYGTGAPPAWLLGAGFMVGSNLASILRAPRTLGTIPAGRADARLVVRGPEGDAGSRRVRERLCALELPYRWEPGPLRLEDLESGEVLQDVDAILAWLG